MELPDGQVLRVEITKTELERLPAAHLAFVVTAAHIANELNTLRTVLIFESRNDGGSEFIRSQTTVRWLTLARVTLGKVLEFDNALNGHIGCLVKSNDGWLNQAQRLVADVLGKRRRPGWLQDLRNKLAFHYDVTHVANLVHSSDVETLHFFITNAVGHTVFPFVEEIVSMPLFQELGADKQNGSVDPQRGATLVFDFLNERVARIVDFVHQYIVMCFEMVDIVPRHSTEPISPEFLGDLEKVSNPVLVSPRVSKT